MSVCSISCNVFPPHPTPPVTSQSVRSTIFLSICSPLISNRNYHWNFFYLVCSEIIRFYRNNHCLMVTDGSYQFCFSAESFQKISTHLYSEGDPTSLWALWLSSYWHICGLVFLQPWVSLRLWVKQAGERSVTDLAQTIIARSLANLSLACVVQGFKLQHVFFHWPEKLCWSTSNVLLASQVLTSLKI